jgi:hypothetical protein
MNAPPLSRLKEGMYVPVCVYFLCCVARRASSNNGFIIVFTDRYSQETLLIASAYFCTSLSRKEKYRLQNRKSAPIAIDASTAPSSLASHHHATRPQQGHRGHRPAGRAHHIPQHLLPRWVRLSIPLSAYPPPLHDAESGPTELHCSTLISRRLPTCRRLYHQTAHLAPAPEYSQLRA